MECRISWANTNVILKKTVAAIVSSKSFGLIFTFNVCKLFIACMISFSNFYLVLPSIFYEHTDTQTY